MATFSVQQIIDRAKAAADMRDDFVQPATWINWLNVAIQKLERLIAATGYLLREIWSDVTINGDQFYPLSGAFAICAVFQLDNDRFRYVPTTDMLLQRSNSVDTGDAAAWRAIIDQEGTPNIEFIPRPTSGTYRVFMVLEPARVTTVTDIVQYPMGWEEYLVLELAKRALAKEETSNPMIDREHDDITRHIEATSWDRQFAGAHQIRNVDKLERGWQRFPFIPSVNRWQFF